MSLKLSSLFEERKYGTSSSLVDNTTFIGVEIEVEGKTFNTVRSYFSNDGHIGESWDLHEDGSLNNGAEFVFKEPWKGQKIITSLDVLRQFMERTGPYVAGHRCGLHVHLDVRDLSAAEILNFILTYLVFEKFIYAQIDPDRIKNPFCKPMIGSSYDRVINAIYANSGKMSEEHSLRKLVEFASSSNVVKYTGLNLRPIGDRGSVEFRMHEGITNPMEIIRWINIILSLKKISKEWRIDQLLDMEFTPRTLEKLWNTRMNFDYPGVINDITLGKRFVERVLNLGLLIDISENLFFSKEPKSPVNLSVISTLNKNFHSPN